MEYVTKIKSPKIPGCNACMRGKSRQHSPNKKQASHRYRETMYRLHTDMSGIIQTLENRKNGRVCTVEVPQREDDHHRERG
eukprot:668476-Rhodomonas_salina.5